MKLLLHTCCAPCSVYCIKTLRANDIEPTLYWYNPNIHPYQEYKARRDCLREYAKLVKVKLLEDDAYGLDAKENGFDTVSTTLLYSIYQQHEFIDDFMKSLSQEYGIDYYYHDFREGWKEGQEEARRVGLYMQKYCGCIFSEEESGIGREIGRKMQKAGISPTNANVRKVIEENKVDNIVIPEKLKNIKFGE